MENSDILEQPEMQPIQADAASTYSTLSVAVPSSAVELLSDFLFERGALGIEEQPCRLELGGAVGVLLCSFWGMEQPDLDLPQIAQDLSSFLQTTFGIEASCTLKEQECEDWTQSWKGSFYCIEVGKHFSVVPSWEHEAASKTEAKAEAQRKPIVIEPGQVFGTGHHESTYLALRALDEILPVLRPRSVIDVGCGSGILSIACKHFSPDALYAVDIDPQVEQEFPQNMRRSGFAEGWELRIGEVDCLGLRAELVVANIVAEVLIENAEKLIGATANYGSLLLSGIYGKSIVQVREVFLQHCIVSKAFTKNDWSALWLQKMMPWDRTRGV